MSDFLTLTAGIVSAHVEHNRVHSNELPALIKSVHDALAQLGAPEPEAVADKPTRAVSARKSLASPNAIISMIDGKPYQALRRHLRKHGYTEHTYRETFGLPRDYPMVAPAYSEHRRALAKTLGLGRKKIEKAAAPVVEAVRKRGRKAVDVAREPVAKVARKARKSVGEALDAAREHLPA